MQTLPTANDPSGASLDCDVLVVGGGINGAGIVRDLAGRGLAAVLVERDDLAAHTSSSSTKLIHGGLRYLEHREFGLVRKALAEREVLLRSAPHIMWPLRFVLPHDPSMRPAWMIRAGLFLYDRLARRDVLPAATTVDLRSHPAGAPLAARLDTGFAYSDGWVDDARLVVLCAVDARARGATILTRTTCTDARRDNGRWLATLRTATGTCSRVRARALVNAAGPWAARFLGDVAGVPAPRPLRLIKGSHVVVPKVFDHDFAYLFQNPDGRIIFAIPYEGRFTLIGTTDVEHHGDPGSAAVDDAEIAYLCAQASRYFARPIASSDVVHAFCGVRPLLDDAAGDPSSLTRDYRLELDAGPAPLLNVWGGKITTFRRLAEEAADALAAHLPGTGAAWTRSAHLPGGDLGTVIGPTTRPDLDFARFVDVLLESHPDVPRARVHRLARAHGTRCLALLDTPPGAQVAPGLHEAELEFLREREWARCADDVLWRRGKLGLHLDPSQRRAVHDWCTRHWGGLPQAHDRA